MATCSALEFNNFTVLARHLAHNITQHQRSTSSSSTVTVIVVEVVVGTVVVVVVGLLQLQFAKSYCNLCAIRDKFAHSENSLRFLPILCHRSCADVIFH